MINIIIGIAKDIKRLFSYVSSLPLPNRIGSYVLIVIAVVACIASFVFCALMAWGAIEALFNGSIFDNPPAEDWDIR